MNITAPTVKAHLPNVIKDLQELKLAFLLKGDEDKEKAKSKFLRECRRARGEPEPAEPKVLENEEEKVEALKVPEDKMKMVEKIIAMKRRQGPNATRRAR